jgi:tetratricopeptide (TPR) repeat protein
MGKKGFIKTILSIVFSFMFLFVLLIGGLIYFGKMGKITNAIAGMYYVNQGDKALRKHKLPKAITFYQKGLGTYPKHYEAWTNLGNIYVIFEDFYDARDAYLKAIELKPNYTMARMNYGIIATEKLGDFDEAIKQFQSIINAKHKGWIIPFMYNSKKSNKINKGLAYYNLGVTYRLKSFFEAENQPQAEEDLRNSIKAYEEALKILPDDYDTIFNLGLVYQLSGNTKKAATNYCKAIAIQPMNYETHYNLAVLLRHLKMYKEAYNEIEKASLLASEGSNVNSNTRSYVFDILNDMTMSLIINDDYKYLVEKQPQTSEITYVKGKIVATEDLDKAILENFKKCEAQGYIDEDKD